MSKNPMANYRAGKLCKCEKEPFYFAPLCLHFYFCCVHILAFNLCKMGIDKHFSVPLG